MSGKPYYIVMIDGSGYEPMYRRIFADLEGRKDVSILIDHPRKTKLKQLLVKPECRRFFGRSFDFLANEKNNLYHTIRLVRKKTGRHRDIHMIFTNGALYYNGYMPRTLLRYKKEFPGLTYHLFYLDIVSAYVCRDANLLRKRGLFDHIFTVDGGDAETYGFTHTPQFYSRDKQTVADSSESDAYFAGALKGREKLLLSICRDAREHDADVQLDLIQTQAGEDAAAMFRSVGSSSDKLSENILPENGSPVSDKSSSAEGFDAGTSTSEGNNSPTGNHVRIHQKVLPYDRVLQSQLKANVMLDLVQKGQTALTLRPYEAVVYNRKLLSNNPAIKNFPYYDGENIRYFQNVSDIDWEWVRDKSKVNYNYRDEFSPIHLLEQIDRVSPAENITWNSHGKGRNKPNHTDSIANNSKVTNQFPDVTVLVLTYKPDYDKLFLTLRSILLQKKVHLQIVISDDGTEDFNPSGVESFLKENHFDNYVITSLEQNGGTVKNVLNGLEHCRGRYTKLISPGDCLYGENILRNWIYDMEKAAAVISFADCIYYQYQDGCFTPVACEAHPQITDSFSKKDWGYNYLVFDDRVTGAATLADTGVLINYMKRLRDKVIYTEDNAYRLMAAAGERAHFFHRNAVLYEHGSGISTSKNKTWIDRIIADDKAADEMIFNEILVKDKPGNKKLRKNLRKARTYMWETSSLKRNLLSLTIRGKIRNALTHRLHLRYTGTGYNADYVERLFKEERN